MKEYLAMITVKIPFRVEADTEEQVIELAQSNFGLKPADIYEIEIAEVTEEIKKMAEEMIESSAE